MNLASGNPEFDQFPYPAWVEDSGSGEVTTRNRCAQAMSRSTRCAVSETRMRRFPIPALQTPGTLVVMEPYPGEPGCGLEDVRTRIYEALARHEPLETVLSVLAGCAEEALPGVRVVIFQLGDGWLRAHASAASRSRLVSALDGLAPDGPKPAPWWPLRGTSVRIEETDEDDAWMPFREAAEADEIIQCWSDLLVTAAGEVVGTFTLMLPREVADIDGRCRKVGELMHLAALALEQYHLLEELYFLALKDPLTSLWNRVQLQRLLAQAIADSPGRSSVIWLEIAGFQRVNSILGSSIGDEVLCEAASRLKASVRPADQLARVGGDEFAILLPQVNDEAQAVMVATRLQACLAAQFEIQGHSIQLSATAGISFIDSLDDQPDLILRRAKMAMECAQHRASGSLACFEPAMQNRSRDRMEMERLLRNAMPGRELFLNYQPQFCLRTGKLAGCEALMRWRQPDIGLVSPASFICVAEDIGLIAGFGQWALDEACRQGKLWGESGLAVRIGVNVSPHQFQTGVLVGQVEAALRVTGLPAKQLELEITESAVLDNLDSAVSQMRQLQLLGVTFALDDFGTGQSSLAWLRDLPVQRLKIDRRFLSELDAGPRTPILHSIIGLAHELNLTVIIEGVETEQQFESVRELGCDELQGYLRGRPMDPGQFANLFLPPQSL